MPMWVDDSFGAWDCSASNGIAFGLYSPAGRLFGLYWEAAIQKIGCRWDAVIFTLAWSLRRFHPPLAGSKSRGRFHLRLIVHSCIGCRLSRQSMGSDHSLTRNCQQTGPGSFAPAIDFSQNQSCAV